MTPTSSTRRATSSKSGFTLLEMLFVLAIMAMTAALAVPRIEQVLASNADRGAAFQFQRLTLDLRANAYHQERALNVVATGQFKDDDPDADPAPAEIKLEDGWSYRLGGPLTISPRGLCDATTVDLYFKGQPRERLTGAVDCSFTSARLG
jgi:prepilin-type N-terminal cleavage/methylation domain-containing protein